MCERNNSADTNISEEGGGGGAPGTGAEILLQPVIKTMVRQAVPLQPMEAHGGADFFPVCFPVTVIGEWSLPVLVLIHKPYIIFSLPCPAEEGEWHSGFDGLLASSLGQYTTVVQMKMCKRPL